MDDMYIICEDREELRSIIAGIKEQADSLGLFINAHKTHIARLMSKKQIEHMKAHYRALFGKELSWKH